MGTERFSTEEAVRLFSQESEPPTAIDRLNSMGALLNVLRRNSFGATQVQKAREQLTKLAHGILDSPQHEREEVNNTIRSYIRSRYKSVKQLGKELRRELRRATKI